MFIRQTLHECVHMLKANKSHAIKHAGKNVQNLLQGADCFATREQRSWITFLKPKTLTQNLPNTQNFTLPGNPAYILHDGHSSWSMGGEKCEEWRKQVAHLA